MTWLFPGSFDPPTLGHKDLICRAAVLCDFLVVAVLVNDSKHSAFTTEERIDLLQRMTADLPNVSVVSSSGLTVELAASVGACAMLRGLRNSTDLEFEQQIAGMNRQLAPEIETVYLSCAGEYSHISSTMVRSVALHGGDISGFVPEELVTIINDRFRRGRIE